MTDNPLLAPGLHDVQESDLDNHFLSQFTGSTTRPVLIQGFRSYLQALKQFRVAFEIWIDGSFVTNKQDPSDIDLVIFASQADLNSLPTPDQQSLARLLLDRASVKKAVGCDVLFSVAEDQNMRSYWRGWYGFDRLETPKGIARIRVIP